MLRQPRLLQVDGPASPLLRHRDRRHPKAQSKRLTGKQIYSIMNVVQESEPTFISPGGFKWRGEKSFVSGAGTRF
jgi:hypothetical protein